MTKAEREFLRAWLLKHGAVFAPALQFPFEEPWPTQDRAPLHAHFRKKGKA